MSKAQTCDATKGGCGNHYLIPTLVMAADGEGPLDYDAPLLCWGCNSIYMPKRDAAGKVTYQRYANVTALAVLRQIQPPPGTFE